MLEIRQLCATDCWKRFTGINADTFSADISTADIRHGLLTPAPCVSLSFFYPTANAVDMSAVLDPASQVWWRWANVMFTLLLWSVELVVSPDGDDVSTKWKVE